MNHSYYIYYKNVILKPLDWDHIESLRLLRNINSNYFIDGSIIEKEQQEKWYTKYLEKTDDIMFYISNSDDSFLGVIALYDIKNNTAEFGRIMVRPNAPHHTGTNAILGVLGFAKEQLQIKNVVCSVKKNNTKAKYVYENIGFKENFVDDSLVFYSICLENMKIEIN